MTSPVPLLSLLRRLSLPFVLIFSALCLIFLYIQPLNSFPIRALQILSALVFCLSALILLHKRRALFWPALLLVLAPLLWLLTPGRPLSAPDLRRAYLDALPGYEGVPYFWGGEKHFGIDCSGLPRRALCDALLSTAIRTVNSRAARAAISLWWFDSSASALASGYRGQTTPVGIKGVLGKLNPAEIPPGSLAITTSGIHCLVYLGDSRWIQADPGVGHVETSDAKTTQNPWFVSPVTLHQWTVLNPPAAPLDQ